MISVIYSRIFTHEIVTEWSSRWQIWAFGYDIGGYDYGGQGFGLRNGFLGKYARKYGTHANMHEYCICTRKYARILHMHANTAHTQI